MCSLAGGAATSTTMFTCLWNFLDWLDQPVTNSTSGMDSKKVVQATASVTGAPPQSQPQPQAQPQPQPLQQQQQQQQQPQQQTPRVKGVPDGVAPSISGVRRRSGPNQGLRSPAAKRPVSAPVALQGWLHKQGSEGLMLWKKRWFVLSEYCLFYYKGPEEEKLLGSILLPSYRVTVCRPEDKINKKFAFKAEHANMRTYHFAADTRESMNQWVNALTLASLLQDPNPGGGEMVLAADGNVAQQQQPNDGDRSARPSVSSISSIMNQSADDSDSGFHGFQSRDDPSHASNNNSSPNSVNTGSFPGSSGTNTSASNNANNNNNNNNNPVNVNNSVNASMHDTVQQSQPQPLINGWMQQQSPQYRDHGVIGQQSPGVQYNHQMIPGVIQQQPMHQQQIIYQQHPHLAQQQQMMQQQQQQQQHKHNVSPQQQQQQNPGNLPRNYGQPVYANAPPKPRRLTDNPNDYSTPSPDPDYRKSPVSPDVRLSSKSPMSAVEYIDTRNPNAIYGQRMTPQQQQSLRTDKSGLNYGFNQGVAQPAERRTPDTYGRSNTKPAGRQQQVVRTVNGGDYEDVYAGPPPQLYQRPAGPVGYTKGPAPAPIPIPVYTQQPQQQQQQQQQPMHPQYYVVSGPGLTNAAVMRQPPPQQQQQVRTQQPPRPHSADFLEYEATRRPSQQTPTQPAVSGQPRCPQRPKSSLDIVNPSDVAVVNDNYFYSEERYAAQMRQSAVYLHQAPQHLPQQQQQQPPPPPQQQQQPPQQQQQQRNQSLSRATTPSKSTASRDTESGIGTLSEMSCPSVRRSQREHSHQPHSLQRHTDLTSGEASHHLRRSLRESRGPSLIHSDHHSPGRSLPRDYEAAARLQPGVVGSARSSSGGRCWPDQSQQQQFARSASARLPRSRHPAAIIDYDDDDEDDDDDYAEKSSGQDSRDGERKIQQREESMKRLLEWKQRMLQSPLTRKPTASSSNQRNHQQHNADLANCYKQQALLELAAHEASLAEQAHRHSSRRRDDAHHRPHHPRSKSTDARRSNAVAGGSLHHNALPRYNSYSSDDEELSDVRRKRTRRPPHTGRSPRGFEKEPAQQQPPSTIVPPPVAVKPQPPPPPTTVVRSSPARPASSMNYHSDFGNAANLDTGYEEMAFPRPASKMESPVRVTDKVKKPLGILKTPGVYATNHPSTRNEAGRLSTLAGYIPPETQQWPVQKNVQWDSSPHKIRDEEEEEEDEEKEEWDSKIDESKVVKEFSYQYIRQDDEVQEESDVSVGNQDPVNLVQSRIRSFESTKDGNVQTTPEKDTTTAVMQEPLKVSPPQASTEAHVSRLLESPRKPTAVVIREFALGEQQEEAARQQQQQEQQQQSTDRNKSVKDLLADFERKSQQVKQQEQTDRQQRDLPKQRAVFSDTETLLYETGSDLEQPDDEETDQIVPKYKVQPEEKTDSEKQKDETANPGYARLSVAESLVTHGDRLSGESDNTSPTLKQQQQDDPNMEEHYLPMSPRKAILDPNSDERPMPKMMESLFAGLREESSYVEMTQNGTTRSLLAPNNGGGKQDYSDYSTLDNPHYEFVCVADNKMEPVYMELNQLGQKDDVLKGSVKDTANTEIPNSRGDLPDILTALKSDSSDADDESSKDLDSIDAPRHPRFSLSDTFRPASYYLGASQTLIAELHDSSDSELVSPPPIPTSPPPDDLDSLEMQDSLEVKKMSPQVAMARDYGSQRNSPNSWNKPAAQVEVRRSPSRFSEATMSSTFRDSRISLESASGSDSVELRNSEEEARHRQLKRRPVSDDMCEVLDSLDELESLGSRFDGTSIDLDQYLEELQARDAFNVDLYAKDLSYNSIYGLNENMMVADKLQKSSYPEMAKTGPTSESNNSLDQPFRYGTRSKTSSASSLPSMRVSEVPPKTNHQHSQSFTGDAHYENVSRFSPLRGSPAVVEEIREEHSYRREGKNVPSPLASIVATHSRDSSYSFVSGTASVANYSAQRPASAQSSLVVHSPVSMVQSTNTYIEQRTTPQQQQQQQYHSRSASQDSARYSLSPNHRSSSSQDSSQYPASTSTVVPRSASTIPHSQPSDQGGAPYYYSDLQAANSDTQHQHQQHPRPCTIAHTSRLPQLNNQRGDATGLNKRNDIGRMVNPIPRQMPRQIQVDDIDEARRIAAELRKTTCQLLAEDKAALVDRRNFYEADTLRRVKSTDPLPDVAPTDLNARNLYPHGLRDKSGSQTQLNADGNEFPTTTQTSHRRSRSLEGLLDDAGLQNLVEQRNRANSSRQQQQAEVAAQPQQQPAQNVNNHNHEPEPRRTSTNNSTANSTFEGEDPWEQDSLWRESLRRVSLRHARSLDNLDAPSPARTAPSTSEASKARVKITRGVTYVNDSVANSVERPRFKRRSDEEAASGNSAPNQSNSNNLEEEDDAYESLAMDRIGAGGYIWDPENEAYRKPDTSVGGAQSSSGRQHFLAEGNPVPTQQQAQQQQQQSTATSSSFELDREKLRQWDLLSSACLLQEQQRTSMAPADGSAPGRGLPAATASSAAATGCGSAVDASSRQLESTATKSATQSVDGEMMKPEEVKKLVAAGRSNGAASGSGSVIGRDPLPPRAVSTSQLAASTSNSNNVQQRQQQSPISQQVSTLPLPRSSGVGAASVTAGPSSHHRQHNNLPVHQQPGPQSTTMLNMIGHGDHEDYATHILRAASSGDVRMLNNDLRDPRIASPGSGQRLVSPTNHLRVISPVDHRVSSPSDSERHVHSQSDRGLSSPLGRDSERGSNPALRQMQRGGGSRQSGELLHKRSHSVGSSSRRSSSGRPSSGLQVSAGELLGRTHEELVLLLIQLRRQSATLCKAMETCHMEIEAQARLVELDTPRRLENLQKLEELKKHLMDLEKQYEKGKPLVNLVDNMVKLGSLYNCNKQNGVSGGGSLSGSRYDLMPETSGREHRDRLEFNQRVQEQRLLAEERRDWDRLSPDHGQLQAKVQQLYKLDQLLQEESGTLHSLQQNKELLEKALGGLRHKMQGCSRSNPAEAERYREQQLLLERELSRVRLLLAHNSKKLEETVAENARLEQDLVVLRQKLQASRRYAGNVQTRDSTGTTAALEKELRRVQQLVGDLQRQRQELSIQVRQLTEKSHSLVQQIRPQATSTPQVHQSKKRTPNSWLETDLDSGLTQEHGLDVPSSPASSSMSMSPHAKLNGSPYSHQQYNHHNHNHQQQQPLSSPQYVKELQASQSRSPASTSSSSSSQYCVRQVQGQASSPQNSSQISALSPQLREQIQQHQMKQQLLKDQMQGKSSSPVQQVAPLYVNAVVQDPRRLESMKHYEQMTNGGPILPPEYVPPPPPPPSEETIMMNGGYGHDDGKFAGLMHNREKQEIKTVRIVKRESERRQRDRGDRTGNIGIPLTNGLQAPGGARRLGEDEFGGSQQFEAQLDRVLEESQPAPIMHAQSSIQLSELEDTQFQRSMSLPRGFGGQRQPQQQNHPAVHQAGPVPPPPRSDSMTALRNIMARRHRVRFESQDAGSSDSTLSPYTDSPTFSSSQGPASSASSNYYYCHSTSPPYSPPYQQQQPIQHRPYPIYNNVQQQQHYGSTSSVNPMSPEPPARPVLCSSTELLSSSQSVQSLNSATGETVLSPQLSPVFKSEAAKQIIKEMTEKKPEPNGRPRRRQVPREKRRHYTVSSSKPLFDLEDAFTKMGMGRARDDLDMERALRPRINAPDVVRSTLSHKELKYNESTIDQLLGTPNKIVIPERYVPEKTPELTAEEQEQRLKKAESIRKMLSETTVTAADGTEDEPNTEKSNSLKKKVADEKRQRDHILQLNQILAKQVMEKSKMVAVKALATLPLNGDSSIDDDDLSPVTPLPLYQQRENFYS